MMVRKQYTFEDIEPNNSSSEAKKMPSEASTIKIAYTTEESLRDEPENKQETRAEIRARRAMYKEVKQKVKVMEQNNTSQLIVFRDYRTPWFKAGGNSAIYYAFDIAGRMGKKKVNLNVDKDGYATFHDGVVSFHGIENLAENMYKAGYEKPKVISGGWILVFNLNHNYDKASIRTMKKVGKERERKFNELVLPQNEYPKVYSDILTVIKRIPPNIFKLNPNQRQAFSSIAIEKLVILHDTYLKLANGKIDVLGGG